MSGDRKKIIVVDDNHVNLTTIKKTLSDMYDVYPALSAEKMYELLDNISPDMILLDVEMPLIDGYEAARILKSNAAHRDIPIIFLTSMNDPRSEMVGLSIGAVDYIHKPFVAPLLIKRIQTHLTAVEHQKLLKERSVSAEEQTSARVGEIWGLQNAILAAMATLAELVSYRLGASAKPSLTERCVTLLLDGIMKKGLYADETAGWDKDGVASAALPYDIGKIAISDPILLKPGALTADEMAVINTHPRLSVDVIRTIEAAATGNTRGFLRHAGAFAGSHHERWDGSGYPDGLSGRAIPLEGRIMAIADCYGAIRSERPYRAALSHDEAVKAINDGSGTIFDPALVEVFNEIKDELV